MNVVEKELQHGYVISDLHLFSLWTSAEKKMEEIRAAAMDADFFVFNGDIFDFRWSTLGSAEATARAASDWFRELCIQFPHCRFFYVLGNHDSHVALVRAISGVEKQVDNFKRRDAFLRIGTSLFMHGDLTGKSSPFVRKKFKKKEPRPGFIRSGYYVAIRMGVHGLVTRLHGRKRTAGKILKSIIRADPSKLEGIRDIYTGHTHAAYRDFEYKGFRFHNTGSAVHNLECLILKTAFEGKQE